MALSNHERVGKAFEVLKAGLPAFVERELKSAHGAKWLATARTVIGPGIQLAGTEQSPDWDAAGLLRVMWECWNDVFAKTLGRAERSIVSELSEVRNKWAHQKPLLVRAVRRLASDGSDPVVELQTNFGGGKTHSMLALWHLFSGRPVAELPGIDAVMAEAKADLPKLTRRVVLVGNKISPGQPVKKDDGTVVRTLWGELAWQLGGKEGANLAIEAARQFLTRRGNSPRLYQNTLVFLAPDRSRLDELEQAARYYLAWQSIVDQETELNLDKSQSRQAATQKGTWDRTTTSRIGETFQWLLVPTQPGAQAPVEWQQSRLSGPDPLAVRACKRLRNDSQMVMHYAPTLLRQELDKIPLWRGDHVSVKVDAARISRDVGGIANEIIQHLASLPDSEVEVTLEIQARVPGGVPDTVVRTVSENCRTLKFTSQHFEKD